MNFICRAALRDFTISFDKIIHHITCVHTETQEAFILYNLADVCVCVLLFSMSWDRYEAGFTLQSRESLWDAQAAVHGLSSCSW